MDLINPSKLFRYTGIAAVLSLLSVSFFWRNHLLLVLMLALLSAFILLIHKNKEDLYIFLIAGTGGVIAEIICVSVGAWTYTSPMFFGVPLWLFFLWGIAGIFLKRISEKIHFYIKK